MSIGEFVRKCVLENSDLKNQEILNKVLEKFPEAKTTIACIAWYKTDMRKKKLIGPRKLVSKEGLTKETALQIQEIKKKSKKSWTVLGVSDSQVKQLGKF